MGLDTTGAAPAGNTLLVSGTGKLARADDPFFTGVSDQLGGQGLPGYHCGRSHHLGAHGIADVDDIRACLLRHRNDADVDAAL
jgi:hypothetical protein